jgi:hypothetical protein
VAGKTVRDNIDTLVQTFRAHFKKDPTLDPDGRFSSLLSGQISGYRSLDPAPNRQKAISVSVLKAMPELATTPAELAAADLAMGAFFFACRSCEYVKVSGERRTKTIQIGDVQFRHGRIIIPHSSPEIYQAETVAIVFRDQKNRHKMVTRTNWRTTDPTACPVTAWAKIATRVRATKGCNDNTLVYSFTTTTGNVSRVTGDSLLKQLRQAASHVGSAVLGYEPHEIGTHSIRLGAAMALVLSGHQAWRIMLAGRWRSSAFLLYVREQVQAFSKGVSARMIENPDFFHVPDIDAPSGTQNDTVSPLEAEIFNGGASTAYNMLPVTFFG